MKREDKVISLDLAKAIAKEHEKLKLEVESEWWWEVHDKPHHDVHFSVLVNRFTKDPDHGYWHLDKKHPAYDTAELGEMLPRAVPTLKTINDLWIWREDEYNDWMLQYGTLNKFRDSVEAEARGRLYLWLLKEGYING